MLGDSYQISCGNSLHITTKYRGQVYVIGIPSFLSFIACMTSLPPPSPMKLPSKFISSKTGLLSTHLQERKIYLYPTNEGCLSTSQYSGFGINFSLHHVACSHAKLCTLISQCDDPKWTITSNMKRTVYGMTSLLTILPSLQNRLFVCRPHTSMHRSIKEPHRILITTKIHSLTVSEPSCLSLGQTSLHRFHECRLHCLARIVLPEEVRSAVKDHLLHTELQLA